MEKRIWNHAMSLLLVLFVITLIAAPRSLTAADAGEKRTREHTGQEIQPPSWLAIELLDLAEAMATAGPGDGCFARVLTDADCNEFFVPWDEWMAHIAYPGACISFLDMMCDNGMQGFLAQPYCPGFEGPVEPVLLTPFTRRGPGKWRTYDCNNPPWLDGEGGGCEWVIPSSCWQVQGACVDNAFEGMCEATPDQLVRRDGFGAGD